MDWPTHLREVAAWLLKMRADPLSRDQAAYRLKELTANAFGPYATLPEVIRSMKEERDVHSS
jgi:hypothetical protein